MTGWTKGKWRIDFGETYVIRDEDGGRVCTMNWLKGRHGHKGRRSHEEVVATAHLLRTSKELYEALKALVASMPDSHENRQRCQAAWDKANAALSRARGDTQEAGG